MAEREGDETKRKRGATEKVLAGVMTGMLVVGLAGFGFTSYAPSITSIGSVGKIDITPQDYARAVQQRVAEMSQQFGTRITAQQGLQFGLGRQALAGLVTRTTLDNEALALGLSVGDQTVAAEVMKQSAFTGASGSFDRNAYSETLRRNGWTERDYEELLRRDVARSLLQGGIAGGFTAPKAMVDTLYRYIGERRGFSTLRLTAADLTAPLPAPTDEALKAYYQENIARFTQPDATRIRFAALRPVDLAKDQPVDEVALRKLYDDNINEYVVPERRLVERLIYPDAAARDAALAEAQGGKAFEDLVAERGLTMDAADMGDVSEADLDQAGAAVFAAAEGAVVAAETDLGPALFRVNGTLAGENRSFEDMRAELAQEAQFDAARRIIADKVDQIDDLLVGGETLDSLATQTGMKVSQIDYIPGKQGSDPIEGYEAFRKAADALKKGDFPEAILLDDGGVVALEYVEPVPAHPIPFETAREDVLEAWNADALKSALQARGQEMLQKAKDGTPLLSLGILDKTPEISRDGTVPGTPPELLTTVFGMKEGDLQLVEAGDFIAVVQLDTVKPAAEEGDGPAALRDMLASQVQSALAEDAFNAFATAASEKAGINLDQNAIAMVEAGLQ